VGREPWTGKTAALTYFSLLGLGFIAIELVFIQLFMKLIGYPLYAVTTVITVMLIGAALGSMQSRAIIGQDSSRWHVPFIGVIVTGGAIWAGYSSVATYFMASAAWYRILVAATMIFPVAFFMGMPFPIGILELRSKPRGAIAWAWSMNGLFTTVGGVATAVSSLAFGFRETTLAALGVYALAAGAFGLLRACNRRTSGARDTAGAQPRAPRRDRQGIAAMYAKARRINLVAR
jgi:hypothetical protein